MKRWSPVLWLLCAMAFTASLAGCGAQSPVVCIEKKGGPAVCVDVEIVSTPSQRQLGLMYRKELASGCGMLFIFEGEDRRPFTMNNTYVPLDMIFISRDKRIVGWVENARPLTQGPYEIDKPSQYVLEVNAFFCKQKGLAVGDRMRMEHAQQKVKLLGQ